MVVFDVILGVGPSNDTVLNLGQHATDPKGVPEKVKRLLITERSQGETHGGRETEIKVGGHSSLFSKIPITSGSSTFFGTGSKESDLNW